MVKELKLPEVPKSTFVNELLGTLGSLKAASLAALRLFAVLRNGLGTGGGPASYE